MSQKSTEWVSSNSSRAADSCQTETDIGKLRVEDFSVLSISTKIEHFTNQMHSTYRFDLSPRLAIGA